MEKITEELELGATVSTKSIQNSPSIFQIIQRAFNVINHVIIAFVAIYMSYVSYNAGNQPISWHVFLCTLGYQLLMTQSILAFYWENLWSKKFPRKQQKTFHWVLQFIGSSAALIGMIIEFIARQQKSKAHFSSTHSIIGLIAGIFTLIGMLNGISALWAIELKKHIKPVYSKLLHTLNGIIAFVLGMVALYYGYDKKFMANHSEPGLRVMLQAFAIISIILSLFGAIRSSFCYIRTVFSR